jgi:GINS complex subunit 2
LLKKQRRANIVPPPWLHPASLQDIIHHETKIDPKAFSPPPPPPARADGTGIAHRLDTLGRHGSTLSPPFVSSCTSDAPSSALPYHWFETAEVLLAHAADDIPAAAEVRSLLRDLQEVRAAKLRSSTTQLEQSAVGVLGLRGVGAMELAESRAFVLGVMDGVRKIGISAEVSRRENEETRGGDGEEESDEDMGLE